MKLFVEYFHTNGEFFKFLVDVADDATVFDLKSAIARMRGNVPVESQHLTFLGRSLHDDESRLSSHKIESAVSVILSVVKTPSNGNASSTLNLYIDFCDPQEPYTRFLIELHEHATVGDVKMAISQMREDLPTSSQRLTFLGKKLDRDSHTLSELKVSAGASITVQREKMAMTSTPHRPPPLSASSLPGTPDTGGRKKAELMRLKRMGIKIVELSRLKLTDDDVDVLEVLDSQAEVDEFVQSFKGPTAAVPMPFTPPPSITIPPSSPSPSTGTVLTTATPKSSNESIIKILEEPQSPGEEPEAFLSHDWGSGAANNGRDNHAEVSKINDALKARGVRTWFDADCMEGVITERMMEGIDESATIVVFITTRYMEKVGGGNDKDNCRREFLYADRRKPNQMIAVPMHPSCSYPDLWKGPVSFTLGQKLVRVTFEEGVEVPNFDAKVDQLVCEIRRVKKLATKK